jgi:flagellar basal body rod protein FlgC
MVGNITNNAVSGLQTSSLKVAKAADNIANPQKGTEVTEDIIDVKQGQNNFEANALVLQTAKEMQETLFRAVDIEV